MIRPIPVVSKAPPVLRVASPVRAVPSVGAGRVAVVPDLRRVSEPRAN